MIKILYTTALVAASVTAVCASQTPAGAGNFTINGANATAGVATMDANGNARQVLFTTNDNESANTITLYGTLSPNGAIVSEVVAMPVSAGTAVSKNYFLTVTQISTSGAFGAAVTVGTNGVGASQWYPVDRKTNPFTITVTTYLSTGSANWTVQNTNDKMQVTTTIPVPFNHPNIAAVSANIQGNYAYPIEAIRTVINSGTGTVTTIIDQADRNG